MAGIGGIAGESAEDYEERYKKFEEIWKNESGVAAINAFFESEDGPTFTVVSDCL